MATGPLGRRMEARNAGPAAMPTETPTMDHRPSLELLESVHPFPGIYQIKAIGNAEGNFVDRVVEAVQDELPAASDLDYSVRITESGRHASITLHVTVQTADQVRAIYGRIQELPGLTLLF